MIYRNIQTFALKVIQECRSWATKNGAVQMFLLTPNRNMFSGKFLNQKWFSLCYGSILFSASSELRFVKWVSCFEKKYIVKWVIFIASFCWLLEFLLENLILRTTPMMSAGTHIRKLYVRDILFKKKRILNRRFWIINILIQISFSWRLL